MFQKKLYQIKHANVEEMFLQLIAVNFLKVEVAKDDVSLCWAICREEELDEYPPF